MKKIFLFILIFLGIMNVQAQNRLQTPEEFLGYSLGDQFTYHNRVVDYFRYIAENSARVKLEEYGSTYERRPLIVAYIGREKNLDNIEEIKQHNRRRAGIEQGRVSNETAIVWLSYNVHGNESVSTEASMAVLHTLASGVNEEVNEWLENTTVIIDPTVNPDGRDRYANWYNQVGSRIPNPNPEALEHHEPWPGGRPNHYLFDLNRDWAWQTQKESSQRMLLYNQWLPHIHADFHEQGIGSPYYFSPAAEPFHEYISDWQREFQTTIGLNNTRYFDENGWLYFTRERFDLFYPSYGDTYPTFNGAIGMTYEQGGSGKAGLAVQTAEQDTLTLHDRIAHHYATSLSTIEATAKNADKVLENFENFFKQSAQNPPGKYTQYLIPAANNTDKMASLKQMLKTHRIEYAEASQNRNYKGWSYQDGKESSFRTNPGDLVIDAHQPKAVLLQVLFEPESKLRDSVTYDITAWAIPYMLGLEAYATADKIATRKIQESQRYELQINVEKPYAYLQEWNSMEDVRFLTRLLNSGIRVRYAEEPFITNNREYAAGTLIITRRGNENLGEEFDFLVREAAKEWERPLETATTGFVSEGKDFGSGSVRYLKAPKVAVLSGDGVSSLAFGEVWHYFEQQINYPITVLGTDYFQQVKLENYDVLIIPNGYYQKLFDQKMLGNIADWVKKGGRLILMQKAVNAVTGEKTFSVERKEEINPEGSASKRDGLREYGNREREALSDHIAGSIYRVNLDHTHPLAFGYRGDYFSLKTSSDAFQYLNDGWNVGTIRSKDALVSGFVGKRAQEKLAESLVFGIEEKGMGEIIYMVDNPLFRAFWQEGKLLFSNAVFL
jgi:hypothetical protein